MWKVKFLLCIDLWHYFGIKMYNVSMLFGSVTWYNYFTCVEV